MKRTGAGSSDIRCASLPQHYAVDYASLVARENRKRPENLAMLLSERLPTVWRKRYVSSASHVTNLVRLRSSRFEYIYDLYSELETTGEVAFDQTIEDRVIAVFGTSACAEEQDGRGRRGWLESSENMVQTERDRGHFIARSIGGGHDINVFSQDRHLNRGWSPQGRLYRQMETYCMEQAGTFCFSRPIYTDGSSIPRWLEFGVLKNDQTLWVEVFDN
jgi:hypothetical protein